MVQLPFDLCNILVRQIFEVRTLGDILPCEPVGVLIGASSQMLSSNFHKHKLLEADPQGSASFLFHQTYILNW